MSKLRIKNRFGMTPNWLLNSKEVTLKAKGLYGYLQSKPDGWIFSITGICTQCVENRTAIRTALKELEDLKVLIRQQVKGANGRFINEYILFDQPYADDLHADEPYTENLYTKKERVSKKEISNKDKDKEACVRNNTLAQNGNFYRMDSDTPNKHHSSNEDTGVLKRGHRVYSNEEQRENIEKEENKNTLFDVFWDSYPVKKGKKTARVVWKKLEPSQQKQAISDVPLRKEDKAWRAGFIPHPTTYLNQERWEDEIIKEEITPTKLAKELKAKYGGKNDRKAYQEWRKVFSDEKIKLKYQHLFDF